MQYLRQINEVFPGRHRPSHEVESFNVLQCIRTADAAERNKLLLGEAVCDETRAHGSEADRPFLFRRQRLPQTLRGYLSLNLDHFGCIP